MSTITLSTTQKTTVQGIRIEREVLISCKEETVNDVFDTFTEYEKNFVYYLVGEALNGDYRMIDATFDTRPHVYFKYKSPKSFIEGLSENQVKVLHFLMTKASEGKL